MTSARALATLAAALAVLAACTLTGPEPDEVLVLEIGPERVDCMGAFPQQCLLVRSDSSEEWSYFYDHIEGFTYEEGFVYRVEVLRRQIRNPPADGSSVAYRLIRVLSRAPA